MTALETLRHIATLPLGSEYVEPDNEVGTEVVDDGTVTLPQTFLLRVLAETSRAERVWTAAQRFHGPGSSCEFNRRRRQTVCEICNALGE